jgi:hypothetical protein
VAALGILANMLVAVAMMHSKFGFFMNWRPEKTGGWKSVSATFGLIPRLPAALGQRKGESRSISAEDLLSEQGSPSPLPPFFSGLSGRVYGVAS